MNTYRINLIISMFLITSVPLTVVADTDHISGKRAFGVISGINGSLYLFVQAFEESSKDKSNKTATTGAFIQGTNYSGNACWFGSVTTSNIKFNAKVTGRITKHLTASGSAEMSWSDSCGQNSPFTENITFNIDLDAITDNAFVSWGTNHYEYGDIKINEHFDLSQTPAVRNDSFITSPRFGTVNLNYSYLGQSKTYDIEISNGIN